VENEVQSGIRCCQILLCIFIWSKIDYFIQVKMELAIVNELRDILSVPTNKFNPLVNGGFTFTKREESIPDIIPYNPTDTLVGSVNSRGIQYLITNPCGIDIKVQYKEGNEANINSITNKIHMGAQKVVRVEMDINLEKILDVGNEYLTKVCLALNEYLIFSKANNSLTFSKIVDCCKVIVNAVTHDENEKCSKRLISNLRKSLDYEILKNKDEPTDYMSEENKKKYVEEWVSTGIKPNEKKFMTEKKWLEYINNKNGGIYQNI
jgi:hypothetical protein